MVAAPVSRVAVVADPAERQAWVVLARLGPVGERGDVTPVAALSAVGDDVEREPDRVLAVFGVHVVHRVAVGDEDRVALLDPLDVGEQPPVDHLAGEARDANELAAAGRLAEPRPELGAPHRAGDGERGERQAHRGGERERPEQRAAMAGGSKAFPGVSGGLAPHPEGVTIGGSGELRGQVRAGYGHTAAKDRDCARAVACLATVLGGELAVPCTRNPL